MKLLLTFKLIKTKTSFKNNYTCVTFVYMRKIILESTKELITQLQEGKITIDVFLEQHFNENDGKIEWALREPHLGDGGAPSVSSYDIDNAELDIKTLEGSFEFLYVIGYYFGCDNMNNSHEFDAVCEFEIDRKNQELILFFEDIPEREPDNY